MVIAQNMPGMEFLPLIVLIIWLVVAGVILGSSMALTYLVPASWFGRGRSHGARIIVAGFLSLPVLGWLYAAYAPLNHEDPRMEIQDGMTQQEVENRLGQPHQKIRDGMGNQNWIYLLDWSGLSYYSVTFDKAGRVLNQRRE